MRTVINYVIVAVILGGVAAVGVAAYVAPVVVIGGTMVTTTIVSGAYMCALPVTGAMQTFAWVSGDKKMQRDMSDYNFWWYNIWK